MPHRLLGTLLVAGLACVFSCAVPAHDPGLSAAHLRVGPDATILEMAFDRTDLCAVEGADADGDGRIDAAELTAARARLLTWARAKVRLLDGDLPVAPRNVTLLADDEGGLVFTLHFDRTKARVSALEVNTFDALPRGHRQLVTVTDGHDRLVADALLHTGSRRIDATRDGASDAGALARGAHFFVLGIEHILIGYDHVLFLLVLLVAARRLTSVVTIITSFTLAHSVTLGLAALDVVRIAGSWVEPTIAASIVWIAVANLLCREPRHRWRVTFAFGLVHGFGFASVLRDLGLHTDDRLLVSLLSFNAGVEIGQLIIAAIAVPVISRIARRDSARRRLVVGASAGVAVIGMWWLLERTVLAA